MSRFGIDALAGPAAMPPISPPATSTCMRSSTKLAVADSPWTRGHSSENSNVASSTVPRASNRPALLWNGQLCRSPRTTARADVTRPDTSARSSHATASGGITFTGQNSGADVRSA
ncbi:MAG: hypothetical protein U1F23_01840 [Lysobacterales bacterium]